MGKSSSGHSCSHRSRRFFRQFRYQNNSILPILNLFYSQKWDNLTTYLFRLSALRAYVEVFSSKPPDWQSFVKFYIVPLNHLFESMIFCPEVWRYLFHKVSIFSQHLNLCIEFFDFILKVSYCLFHFKELLFLWFKLTLTLFISSYLLVQFTAIGSQLIVNFLQRVTLLFFVICFLPIYICFIF